MPTNNSWNSPYLTANGQLLIGSAGNPPVAATITAGSNMTIINGTGSISVNFSNNSTTLAWTDVTSTGQSCTASNGYIADNANLVDMNLPAICSVGDDIQLASNNTGGYTIWPASGQRVNFYSQSVTYPRFLFTSSIAAAAHLVCTKANSEWNIISHEGTYSAPILEPGSIAFVGFSSVFLKTNGSAWGTGNNFSGQLGNNTKTGYSSPISVVGNHSFTQLATGGYYTLALKVDGSCWAWGYNSDGQLGNNTKTGYSSPISVVGNHSFIQVLAGDSASYGLKADGSCWAWGYNGYGNLGNNTRTSYSSPISVVGNHSFIQISAGYAASYGLKADGSCWAWGDNSDGQLGNNTKTSYSSPISVVGNHSFIQIAAGVVACYGLKAEGSCWAWGANTYGQLGNNTTTGYSSPISVVGNISFSRLVMVELSSSNCGGALQANGNLWGWGDNTNGGFNNNISGNSYSSPIVIANLFA